MRGEWEQKQAHQLGGFCRNVIKRWPVAWTRAVGHNERSLDSGCVLKVRLTGFPDELDVGFERKKTTVGSYKAFGLNIWLCLRLALAFRDSHMYLKGQKWSIQEQKCSH